MKIGSNGVGAPRNSSLGFEIKTGVDSVAEKKKKVKMEEGCEENAIGVEGDDLDTGIAN